MAQKLGSDSPHYGVSTEATANSCDVPYVATPSGAFSPKPLACGEPTSGLYSRPAGPGWMFGLCSCCSHCPEALDAACCTYCALSQQYNKLSNNRTNEIYWPVCCGAMFMDVCFTGGLVQCFLLWHLRETIQDRYGIPKNSCANCCAVFFCTCCAQVQQHLEMTSRGDWPGSVCCGLQPGYTPVGSAPSPVVLQ